jgi:hypothetical protein
MFYLAFHVPNIEFGTNQALDMYLLKKMIQQENITQSEVLFLFK